MIVDVSESERADAESRLSQVRGRITEAALRARHDPGSIRLVAVSKGHAAASIRTLAQLGVTDFGENYLQEALPKLDALSDLSLTWHFTGQLQGNKTRLVAERFQWVHAVDRERIAVRLSDQRPHYAPPLNICIQVRLAEESAKGGVAVEQIAELATAIACLPRLKLRGLMCIPPPLETFEEQRQQFDRLASCLSDLNRHGFNLDTLSMGMSADLEAAVAAGATLVRIGTALFGERH